MARWFAGFAPVGHRKPETSWNLIISSSRPCNSWNLIVDYGKSEWKMILIVQNKLGSLFFVKKKEKNIPKIREIFEMFQENGHL